MGDGIGGWVSSLFGSKNKTKATAPTVDANAYQYGGRQGGADEAAGRYRNWAEVAQGRYAPQANYNMANEDRAMGLQARGQLGQVGQMQLARAMGQTPSIAGMQAQQDMQRAAAAQTSAQAGARGAAGMALAQQQAAGNLGNAQAQISNAAQINTAQERLAAEQAAAGTFGAMRGQDLQSQGQSAQQEQFQANMHLGQRQLNDAMSLGFSGQEAGVRNSQLTAGMNQQAQQSANALGATGINAGVAGQNAATNQSNAWGVVGALQSAAGGAAGALGKAGGGSVEGGQPYVVGERGPELIVPSQPGYVVPNHALRGINPTGNDGRPSVADTVVSTWGTGPGVTRAQAGMAADQRGAPIAEDERRASERDARLASSPNAGGVAAEAPVATLRKGDEEKVATVRAYQDHDIDVSGRDEYEADNAERRLRHEQQIARKQQSGGMPKATLSSRLASGGNDLMKKAASSESVYRGPMGGGYVPPVLIPLSGARAGGGPVQMGSGYLVGEQGPELMVPSIPTPGGSGVQFGPGSGGAADGVLKHRQALGQTPSAAAFGPSQAVAQSSFAGSGGLLGGSVAGEDRAHKAFGARFGRNPTAYGDADGGPMKPGEAHVVGERGPEMVVPLGNPLPGVNLHVGDDGRAFYQHDVDVDDGRPRLESRGGGGAEAKSKSAPAAKASAPAPKAAPRRMTDAELLAEADRQIAGIKSQETSSMAQGPAVRMPVAINKVAKRYALADFVPSGRRRQAAEDAPATAYPVAPHPYDLPPPKPPPIEATQDETQFEDSAMQQAIYDYARTLQGQGLGRNSYNIARMMRSEPEGPSFASKMREAKGRR